MIHLDLQPELEAQIVAEARARGMAIGRFVEQMVQIQLACEQRQRVTNPSVTRAISRILQLRESSPQADLNIKDLIDEGRKY